MMSLFPLIILKPAVKKRDLREKCET